MRQVWLGLVGVMAAGAACAESYSFAAVIQGAYQEQTTIQCDGPNDQWAGANGLHLE